MFAVVLAHAIAEIRVWEFFLDPGLIAANDRPQTAANDGFHGDRATFVYENTVGELFWTRYYQYAGDGNRLDATSASGDDPEGPYSHEYDHDAHGNMISMPHLSSMTWNHDDEMQEVEVGSETVYFQYAGGNRTRKFVEKSGTTTEERIYLGAFEIFRKRISGDIDVERESLHISDGTGRILLIETLTIDEGDPVTTPVGMWRYQLSNHIGSASTEINEDGDIISYEEFHPYTSGLRWATRSNSPPSKPKSKRGDSCHARARPSSTCHSRTTRPPPPRPRLRSRPLPTPLRPPRPPRA